jgi:hypothetical protein
MKTFKNINDYLSQAKQNDIVVLGGKGIMDGIKALESKHDTFKVIKATEEKITVRKYRGKNNYAVHSYNYNQEVAVLSSAEFKKLPVLW